MVKRSLIILSGGKAKRFQASSGKWKDKALAKISGKPLLLHIIERLCPIVKEIVICVNDEKRKNRYAKILTKSIFAEDVKIITDLPYPLVRGPLVAIATGLKASVAEYCLVLPCDMPFVQLNLAEFLFKAASNTDVAVPIHPDGNLETIMFVCKRLQASVIAHVLCQLKRERPDDLIRASSRVNFISTIAELRDFDPEFKSFININFRRDLIKPQTRVVAEGPIKRSIQINRGSPIVSDLNTLIKASDNYLMGKFVRASKVFHRLSQRFEDSELYFWAGICRENEGRSLHALSDSSSDPENKDNWRKKGDMAFFKAAQNYSLEAEEFENKCIFSLARHARSDELWCRKQSNTLFESI